MCYVVSVKLLKNSAWTWLKEKHEFQFFSYFINVFNAESTEFFFFLCYSYFSCLYEKKERKKNLNKPRREGEKKDYIVFCESKVTGWRWWWWWVIWKIYIKKKSSQRAYTDTRKCLIMKQFLLEDWVNLKRDNMMERKNMEIRSSLVLVNEYAAMTNFWRFHYVLISDVV